MALTRREFLAASAAAPLLLSAGSGRASVKPKPAFRRGGAIHTMMNWGALVEGAPGTYAARPFDAPRNEFPILLVDSFAQAGFDYVRLTLDVGPFMQLQGSDREALHKRLLDNIALFHARGLGVIVDCHPVEQVPTYSVQSILDDLQGPVFAGYTEMVGRLAALLSGVTTGRIALELMNEPAMDNTRHSTQVKVWGAAQLVLHDAARRAAPDLTLVLTGADYGGISGLTDLDPAPYRGSDVLYSYHYYMPLSFTHQGIDPGSLDYDFAPWIVDLPYPAGALAPDEIARRVEARIASYPGLDAAGKTAARRQANRVLGEFFADPWDGERVAADFARVTDWAARNGIAHERIVLGECGVTRRGPDFTGAPPESRRRWLADVAGLASAAGFGWALWEINGREFGIMDPDNPTRVDPEIVAAVGPDRLRPDQEEARASAAGAPVAASSFPQQRQIDMLDIVGEPRVVAIGLDPCGSLGPHGLGLAGVAEEARHALGHRLAGKRGDDPGPAAVYHLALVVVDGGHDRPRHRQVFDQLGGRGHLLGGVHLERRETYIDAADIGERLGERQAAGEDDAVAHAELRRGAYRRFRAHIRAPFR